MDLRNTFDVPLKLDDAWAVLLDIQRIAPCMPGAELTEVVDPQTYKGKVSVRLGPVALAFNGTAKFVDVVPEERRARVDAQGIDTKGRGGANAQVVFHLEPIDAGTRVVVDTQLNMSGAVAQYGRGAGMIQSVAGQLIGQFAKNLEADLNASHIPDPAPVPPTSAVTPDADTGEAAVPGAPPSESPPVRDTPPVRRPAAPAKPISGFSLLFAAFRDSLRRLFGKGDTPSGRS